MKKLRSLLVCVPLLVLAIVAPASATAAPIMSDFAGYPDGYQFANFGGVADWALFEETEILFAPGLMNFEK